MAIKSERNRKSAKRAKSKPQQKRAASNVQAYDFARPTKISNEHQVSLKNVSHRLAQSIEMQLSALIRIPVDVTVDRDGQVSFTEFTKLLASPCAAFVFTEGRSGAEGAIDLSTDGAFYLVDRLFGGSGESVQQGRPLSELEQTIVRGVVDRMLDAVKTAWSDHVELKPEIKAYASTPDDLRVKDRGDVVLTRLSVTLETQKVALTIALPLAALDALLQDAPAGKAATIGNSVGPGDCRAAIADELRGAQISIAVQLAPHPLSARSLASLSVGQVIQTNQHVDMPIEVHLNGRPRFLGTLGQVRRRLGVQITEATTGTLTEKPTSGRVL